MDGNLSYKNVMENTLNTLHVAETIKCMQPPRAALILGYENGIRITMAWCFCVKQVIDQSTQ